MQDTLKRYQHAAEPSIIKHAIQIRTPVVDEGEMGKFSAFGTITEQKYLCGLHNSDIT